MKRVTIYKIAGEERAVQSRDDRVIMRELKSPRLPWNVEDADDAEFVDTVLEVARVRRPAQPDCYIAIEPKLAELLVAALETAYIRAAKAQVDAANEERRLVERRLNATIVDLGRRLDDSRRLYNRVCENVDTFRSLPWYKRLWRAWCRTL